MAESAGAFDGKVALVTGAASGIGLEAARQLVAAGASVLLTDLDPARGEAAAGEVGGRFVRADVRSPQDNAAAVAAAESAYGGLDLVFLNAGMVTGTGDVLAVDPERYRTVVAVNQDGVFYGVQAALPALRRRGGGAIVVTASLSGLTPAPADPVYCMTKMAVVGLVRALAVPLERDGVRINSVCPGFIDTPLLGEHVEAFREHAFPLLTAEQVASTLLTAAASDETGQAWLEQPGRPAAPYRFRGVPGALDAAGNPVAPPVWTG